MKNGAGAPLSASFRRGIMIRAAQGHELCVKNKAAEQSDDRKTKSYEKSVTIIVMNVIEEKSRDGSQCHPREAADNPPG